jgi:hypothetical protein
MTAAWIGAQHEPALGVAGDRRDPGAADAVDTCHTDIPWLGAGTARRFLENNALAARLADD